jgi:DNA-binding transcriptional LysR family regulator
MFERLFAESGLSLDRLKAFLAVGAAGSIVKAARGDSVKQSQYSRQIKELEDFFRIKLVERHDKGVRLTANGRELARISRFFMLGLSNFQRGCLAEEQTFRMGASPTVIDRFLLPVLSSAQPVSGDTRYVVESVGDEDIERRLHDLTLDFGITTRTTLSRPLQLKEVGRWRLRLWAPVVLPGTEKGAARAFRKRTLPLAFAEKEIAACEVEGLDEQNNRVVCESFLQALSAMEGRQLAALLPDYMSPPANSRAYLRVPMAGIDSRVFRFHLAWNPRLFRLNPHALRRKDDLMNVLVERMRSIR